jgi:hypothetical protein
MAVSEVPWSNVPNSAFRDANDYCRSALIDRHEAGAEKTFEGCSLPVRMPNGGPVNRAAAHAAAAVLAGGRGGVNASAEQKAAAARRLVTIYTRDLKEEPPEALLRMAR